MVKDNKSCGSKMLHFWVLSNAYVQVEGWQVSFCITCVEVFRSRSFEVKILYFDIRSQSFKVKYYDFEIWIFSKFFSKFFEVQQSQNKLSDGIRRHNCLKKLINTTMGCWGWWGNLFLQGCHLALFETFLPELNVLSIFESIKYFLCSKKWIMFLPYVYSKSIFFHLNLIAVNQVFQN